ncbi:hypothetical protein E2C01_048962 [Portunus trituberculatus]|uniref:Secreted protein n=1 Tax=Portunus trituberculatus TaxID=210409 RepID=A0A5B7G506_PORTR|nr:hypothetical protein [Portunus trituberculatus]
MWRAWYVVKAWRRTMAIVVRSLLPAVTSATPCTSQNVPLTRIHFYYPRCALFPSPTPKYSSLHRHHIFKPFSVTSQRKQSRKSTEQDQLSSLSATVPIP